MGKKKKQKQGIKAFFDVRKETERWIFSILSFAIMFFFILASLDKAGIIGATTYKTFTLLFGTGYFLFPLAFLLLGIVFLKSLKPNLVLTGITGVLLLFLSGLGIIDTLMNEGGIVGSVVSSSLITLFDFYTTLVILTAFFLTSLLLIFDAAPPVQWIAQLVNFLRRREGVSEKEIVEYGNNEEEPDKEEEDAKPEGKEVQEYPRDPEGTPGKDIFKNILPFITRTPSSGAQDYTPPPLSLLEGDRGKPGAGDIKANANIIKRTLQNFGINVEMDEVSIGPSITRYALKPAQGVKLSRIVGLQNDLSLALAAHPLRLEAPIPGKSLLGIEIPNNTRTTVGLGTLLREEEFRTSTRPLLFSLGRSVTGKPYFGDLDRMPHLLVAGATGAGVARRPRRAAAPPSAAGPEGYLTSRH